MKFGRYVKCTFYLQGNGYKLFHTLPNSMRVNVNNDIKVQFWMGVWNKGSPRGPYASREEILMTLENVEQILIR